MLPLSDLAPCVVASVGAPASGRKTHFRFIKEADFNSYGDKACVIVTGYDLFLY
jgi:hypothetical protein